MGSGDGDDEETEAVVVSPVPSSEESEEEEQQEEAQEENGDTPVVAASTPAPSNLLEAVQSNQLDVVRDMLLLQHSSTTTTATMDDSPTTTLLHVAVDLGLYDMVVLLLQQHDENDKHTLLHATDADGIGPLQAAVIQGHVEICRLLLQEGGNPDQEDWDGDSPRLCAVDDDNPELVALFQDDDEEEDDETTEMHEEEDDSILSWRTKEEEEDDTGTRATVVSLEEGQCMVDFVPSSFREDATQTV